jgi:hypothetical protein
VFEGGLEGMGEGIDLGIVLRSSKLGFSSSESTRIAEGSRRDAAM